MHPSKRLFESEEHFNARLVKPLKRLFESDEHFRRRVGDVGEAKKVVDGVPEQLSAKAREVWDRTRCIKEHDGRIAARCDDYPKHVGYGAHDDEAKTDLLRAIGLQ